MEQIQIGSAECFAFAEPGGAFMAVIYAYCDESGKFRDHRAVTFCALSGPLDSIQGFERHWRRQLRAARLPGLHMCDALRAHKPLSDRIPAQSVEARIKALMPFARVIRDHVEMATGFALNTVAFRAMSKKARKQLGSVDNPHYPAFLRMIMQVTDGLGPNDVASLICDDDEQVAPDCYGLYRRVKKIHPRGPKLACLSFADDAVFLPLQGADMFASLMRLDAHRQFFGEKYDYRDLWEFLASVNPHMQTCFAGESTLKSLSAKFDDDDPDATTTTAPESV